jgi:hypothetical protein
MKDAIIAKLANQAADYFGDAFKQCQYKDTLPKVSYAFMDSRGLHAGIGFSLYEKQVEKYVLINKCGILMDTFEE